MLTIPQSKIIQNPQRNFLENNPEFSSVNKEYKKWIKNKEFIPSDWKSSFWVQELKHSYRSFAWRSPWHLTFDFRIKLWLIFKTKTEMNKYSNSLSNSGLVNNSITDFKFGLSILQLKNILYYQNEVVVSQYIILYPTHKIKWFQNNILHVFAIRCGIY